MKTNKISIETIQKYLQKNVSPHLQKHYGNVKAHRIENNTLYIHLLGQCACCPSAHLTVEYFIEKKIKENFSQIQQVCIEQSVSDELLILAKKVLSGKTVFAQTKEEALKS